MKKLTIISLYFVLLIGCNPLSNSHPDIVLNISSCEECKMLISDRRFAAYLKTIEPVLFDDLACMVRYKNKLSSAPILVGFMDYESENWLTESEVVFVRMEGIKTPMNSGYFSVNKYSSLLNKSAELLWSGSVNDLQERLTIK